MADKQVSVKYDGDSAGAESAVDRINRKQNELGKGVDSLGQKTRAFGKNMMSVGKKATIGLTLPIVALGTKAVQAFREAESALAATENVIESTGGAANVTAKHVTSLASGLQKVTAFEDDATQAGANLLLTFTNIRNEVGKGNDIFDQSVASMLDMSQALGQDMKSSAIQLGKALNDPIKGVTALSRVGVSFTAQQKKQIKAMVESGDVIGAQKLILAELTREFGGAAEAFAKTDAGKQAQEMNKLGDAMEKIGAAISPIVTKVAGVISTLAQGFTNLSPKMQNIVLIALAFAAALGPAITIIGAFATAIGFLLSPVGAVIAGVLALGAVVFIVFNKWNSLSPFFKVLFTVLLGIFTGGIGLLALVVFRNWDKIRSFTIGAFNAVLGFFKAWWPVLLGIFTGGLSVVVGLVIKNWGAITGATRTAWNAVTGVVGGAISTVRGIAVGGINTIRSAWTGGLNGIRSAASAAWNFVVGVFQSALNKIRGIVNTITGLFSKLAFWRSSPSLLEIHAADTVKGIEQSFGGMAKRLPRMTAQLLGPSRRDLPSLSASVAAGGGHSRVVNVGGITIVVRGGTNASAAQIGEEAARAVREELLAIEGRNGRGSLFRSR